MNTLPASLCSMVLAGLLWASAALQASAFTPEFNRDIRPILSDNCFACHGPDLKKVKSGLRLDQEQAATSELESGFKAIVPGHPGDSELIHRITTEDGDDRMPPEESGKSLTPRQIELLRKWIEAGAEWQPHWAYRTLQKVTSPEISTVPGFVQNPIDRFILGKLSPQDLSPSPMADRTSLIRRLSFDLTGLPPSQEQVKQFVNDASGSAYENLVDRLMGSDAYGERMAMYWLDQVRYADTCGYHGDQHVDLTLYRDYVIDAFNENKPFDEFTIEQLAGDLLPEASMEQKIASGYNRLLMTTEEGGSQPKEYMAKYAADRVRNTSTVWLGSTMGCAECHDHKFDPFTTRDFYSFAAFFADIKEKPVGKQDSIPVPSSRQEQELEALQQKIAPLKKELDTQTSRLDKAQDEWEKAQWKWTLLQVEEVGSTNGSFFEIREDESILVSGQTPDKDLYTIQVPTTLKDITAFRLEVLPDDSLPNDGPGRYDSGNFVLSEFEVLLDGEPIELEGAQATYAQDKFPASNAIDKKHDTGWAIDKKPGEPQQAIFQTKTSRGDGKEKRLTFRLRHDHGDRHSIGRFRLAASTTPRPGSDHGPQPPPIDIADIIGRPADQRSEEQANRIAAHYRSFAPLLQPVRQRIDKWQKKIDEINKGVTRTMVTATKEPHTMRVLPRGNWLSDEGAEVQPAVPEFMPSLEIEKGQRATRLDLAQWLVSEDNPLTARVFVNRLWKIMFGRGIVGTLDDFGSQGTWPAHVELLDWLAYEFQSSGWDVKHIMKLLAMSGAYRQSSEMTPSMREADPYNELFARQGRYRLDAEMVRDNALAVSALLDRRVGGTSVKPYQPVGYWAHLNFPKRTYQKSSGDDLYRRGLYTYWCRTFLHPSLAAFDAPTREECTVERVRSNTPQQALVLLNDPTYVEAARVMAELLIRQGGDSDQDKINFAFQRILSRLPTPDESVLLLDLHGKHLREYQEDPEAAGELITVGDWPLLKDIDRPQLAAWASVTRVLLNLHETITRR